MNRNHPTLNRSKFPVVLALLAIFPCARAQEPQKPQQPEDVVRVYTDLVQTDVMVFDKQGRFVSGLKRDDFALRVDGQMKPIEFLDRVAGGSIKEQSQVTINPSASNDTSALAALDRGRAIFFYVDDFHLSPGDLIVLRKALLKFVDDDLGQNDEAVITSASGQIGFLQQLTDNQAVLRSAILRMKAQSPTFVSDGEEPPMNEHQALVIDRSPAAMGSPASDPLLLYFIQRALENGQGTLASVPSRGGGSSPADLAELRVRTRARAILEQAAHFTTNSLASFESLVDSSTQLPGRKLVFFISDGFYTDRRNSNTSQKIDQIIHRATRNGVVIYSLDARALTTGQPQPSEKVDVTEMTGVVEREQRNELSESREGMTILAVETGGRTIFDTNALDTGIANAVRETAAYYLLGWRASHEMQTARKSPRVEVSLVNHPDLTVQLAHGFAPVTGADSPKPSATKSKSEKPSELKLRDTLVGIYPSKQLPLALELQYQKSDKGTLLTASVQVPITSLSLAKQGDKDSALADVGGFIYNDQGKVAQHFNKRMALTPADSNSMPDQSFTFKYQAVLPPGLYQVRAGMRDDLTGKIGTVHEWIELPNLSDHKLALSSLITGEVPSETQKIQSHSTRMILRANHHFHRDSVFHFLLYAYNAGLASTSSKADLAVQARFLRDRKPVITTNFMEVPTSDLSSTESIPVYADLPLKILEPGRYTLRVTVIDNVAKLSASQEIRIEIE